MLVSALASSYLVAGASWAEDKMQDTFNADKAETRYEGAPVLIDPGSTKEVILPKAPAITAKEFPSPSRSFLNAAPVVTAFYEKAPPETTYT